MSRLLLFHLITILEINIFAAVMLGMTASTQKAKRILKHNY